MDVREQFENYKSKQKVINQPDYKVLQQELQTQQIQNRLIENQFLDLQQLTMSLQKTLKAVSSKTNQNTANNSYELEQNQAQSTENIYETVKIVTTKLLDLKSEISKMGSQDPEQSRLQFSLMKRQLQNDYLPKIKQTIQQQIFKNEISASWDSPKMREILRQHFPLGNLILDDDFFESSLISEFKPCSDINEFTELCQ